jgi:hypothetical protein
MPDRGALHSGQTSPPPPEPEPPPEAEPPPPTAPLPEAEPPPAGELAAEPGDEGPAGAPAMSMPQTSQ